MSTKRFPVWDKEEERQVIKAFEIIKKHGFKRNGQLLPSDIFFKWKEIFYSVSIEFAILSPNSEGQMVFLSKRPNDDPYFSELWHFPGSILLPQEKILDAAIRVLKNEIGIVMHHNKINFLGVFEYVSTPRGHELSLFYTLVLTKEEARRIGSARGRWFPAKKHPEQIVAHHKKIFRLLPN